MANAGAAGRAAASNAARAMALCMANSYRRQTNAQSRRWISRAHVNSLQGGPCIRPALGRYTGSRGWRGRVPRQPGQVRKEAAPTRPSRVVASLSPSHTFSVAGFAVHGLARYILSMAGALIPEG